MRAFLPFLAAVAALAAPLLAAEAPAIPPSLPFTAEEDADGARFVWFIA